MPSRPVQDPHPTTALTMPREMCSLFVGGALLLLFGLWMAPASSEIPTGSLHIGSDIEPTETLGDHTDRGTLPLKDAKDLDEPLSDDDPSLTLE